MALHSITYKVISGTPEDATADLATYIETLYATNTLYFIGCVGDSNYVTYILLHQDDGTFVPPFDVAPEVIRGTPTEVAAAAETFCETIDKAVWTIFRFNLVGDSNWVTYIIWVGK